MNKTHAFFAAATIVAVILGFLAVFGRFGQSANSAPSAPVRTVTDVKYEVAYPVGHTFLCTDSSAGMARDWHFTDRWVKPQLTYDMYVVDGRTYNSFRIVTDDPKLPRGYVRFRKVVVNIGDGPVLEGHSYLNTRINGQKATIERELLFVEFNGKIERQRRPLSACGIPRS